MKFQASNAFSLAIISVITFKSNIFQIKFMSDVRMTYQETSSKKVSFFDQKKKKWAKASTFLYIIAYNAHVLILH